MISFKQFLTERFKSKHESKIRAIVSKARWENQKPTHYGTQPPRFCEYGDCDTMALHAMRALRKHYPSTKMVATNDKILGQDDVGGHAWVEIPEIKHYVDPSYDQFKTGQHKFRNKPPSVNGHYPNNIVRIGKMDKHYKKEYGTPNHHPWDNATEEMPKK